MNNKGFHLSVSAVSKAKNHSVVAKSAYNSGSKLVDGQSGVVHDYTSKAKDKILNLVDSDGTKYTQVIEKNVVHMALITPTLAGDLAVTREGFWNDIERIETRKNAQLGTEIDVMFPDGITADQRIVLAERYAQTLSDRYNVLVDVAIHRPHSHEKHVGEVEVVELTSRNFHAHILLSSREIVADVEGYALSARKNWLQWSTEERLSKGLNGRGDELKYQRTLWADMANKLLPENKTISEKSYRELGISLLPKMKLGKSLYKDILKGNRSVIHEYNETIDEINAYIEKNGLVIEYDDKGRIDLESNEQEVNGVTVHYKKRKPFARIELSNIRFVDPAAELEPAIPKNNSQTHSDVANDHALDELLAISADFVSQKKMVRSALFSTIDALYEELALQSKQIITIDKNIKSTQRFTKEVGQDFSEPRQKMIELARKIHTKEQSEALKTALASVDQFRQDDTLQTGRAVSRLEEQLSQIDKTVLNNKAVLKNLIPLNNRVIDDHKALKATLKPFAATLNKLATDFKALDEIDIEKTELQRHWRETFEDLQAIEITSNLDTYHKFAALADLDVERFKALEQEREALRALKAVEIDDTAEARLKMLVSDVKTFKTANNEDIKQLKLQINTSQKTYQRLSPFYEQRIALLDQSEAVIVQDDDLYDEITRTKTTQLNADRLDDWRNRTMRLQYQLNKAHEQAELKKKAERAREEAEKRRQEKQQKEQDATALARTRQAEVKAYQSRFDNMLVRVKDRIDKIDFKAIDTTATVIEVAEKLAAEALVLKTLQHTDNVTALQKRLRDTDAERVTIDRDTSVQTLLQALGTLPSDRHKIDTINALNERFEQVPDIRVGTQNLAQILAAQVLDIDKAVQEKARHYSSPRPF
ncbi:MobA/MobL family protein [Psychrobacter sp. K31L]|uniref:MobA/MobL family protein n=1 Tax=Psychrobacter sp. K31L TaxID=2820758 RepID=UPI001B343AB5|nr:MobA/MobL family protein [Psychrobacter sp. K31L]MBP3947248.1 MobA/MobL family protein [Psychrobacter sp. K31L]